MLHVHQLPLAIVALGATWLSANQHRPPVALAQESQVEHSAGAESGAPTSVRTDGPTRSESPRNAVDDAVPGRAPIVEETGPLDPRVERAWLDAAGAALGEVPPPPDFTRLAALDPDRPLHAEDADGTRRVRGSNYMARFGAEGASYTPFLGSDAPRTWPVGFALASVLVGDEALAYERSTPVLRAGEAMRYDRGGVTERYEIRADSIEQVFVLDELPARDEVVLRIAVTTDLMAFETDAGIEFANERGGVRYGRATALDASGASIAAPTTLIGDEIEIRVPASFVATARLPLTIDPIISTWTIVSSGGQPLGSYDHERLDTLDCVYDATHGRWLIVWLDTWVAESGSRMGHLVWRLVGTLNGQTIASGFTSTHRARSPRCANNNASNQFLLGWLLNGTIEAQTISAASGAQSAVVTVASSATTFAEKLSVCGDPYPSGPSYFLVGWMDRNTEFFHYRMLNGTTFVGTEQSIAPPTPPVPSPTPELAISRSKRGTSWNAVWTDDQDVWGTRISWNGAALPPARLAYLDGYSPRMTVSHALGGTDRWAFAFSKRAFTVPDPDDDVVAVLVDGLTWVDAENVGWLVELAGNPYPRGGQTCPSIDTDGRSFAITYTDERGANGYGYDATVGSIHVATLAGVGNRLLLSEFQIVDYGPAWPARIASTHGSGLSWRLNLLLHQSPAAGNPARAALYDNALFTSFCHPGYDGVPTCPCGNAPSQYGRGCNNPSNTGGSKLYGTGISSVGDDSMLLTALNLPTNQTVFFYQGTAPLSTAVFSGRGVRCVAGTQLLLYTKPSTPLGTQAAATAPYAGEVRIAARSAQLGAPILAGQTRYYYAAYRTVGTSGGGNGVFACTTGFAQTVTQSLQAVWIP